jgi:hypothetical protein
MFSNIPDAPRNYPPVWSKMLTMPNKTKSRSKEAANPLVAKWRDAYENRQRR